MKFRLQLIILFFGSGLTVYAQNIDTVKLNKYFDALEKHNKIMGNVAVSSNGSVIYKRSLGFTDVERNLRADENSLYRIGSISKTFTSILVMKAIEQNKLALQHTVNKYFPAVKNADKITISHLLSHRSGIHSFTQSEDYFKWNTAPKTAAEMLALVVNASSDFEPGSKNEYSNSNYVLLTFILEKIFKESYPRLISKHITTPLGLRRTQFGGKINGANNEAFSYQYQNKWVLQSETDMSIPLGAGGIISNAAEIVKFADGLFNGKLISAASVKLMQDSAYGLFKIPFYDKFSFGHGGGIDEFTSIYSHFPNEKISYSFTSNGKNFDLNNISLTVLSAIFNRSYGIPDFSQYDVKEGDLDHYVGNYTSTQIPLKINMIKADKTLKAEVVGQTTKTLRATAQHVFVDDEAGVVVEFNPKEKNFKMKQRGQEFLFTKN